MMDVVTLLPRTEQPWQLQALRWQQLGILRPLDLALVNLLARQQSTTGAQAGTTQPDGTLWLWLALTSSQLAQGHVCLDLRKAIAQPELMLSHAMRAGRPLQELQRFVSGQQLEQIVAACEAAAVWVGHAAINDVADGSDPLHSDLRIDLNSEPQVRPFVLQQHRLYLYRYWQYEQQISRFIRLGLYRTAALRQQLEPTAVRALLCNLFPTSVPPQAQPETDWQQLACAMAATSSMAVITGGPGTGKTTTVVKLLLLLQQLALQQGRPLSIVLAAPTGKAAARLSLSVSQALTRLVPTFAIRPEVAAQIPAKAQTLHRLLGSGPDRAKFRYHADDPLPLDVLVVDEASMVDVALFAAMLAALPASARLILLGDKDQLASVEAGAVMAELCRDAQSGGYSQATANWLTELTGQSVAAQYVSATATALEQQVVMLRTSHRFAAHSGIGQLAKAVNQGDVLQTQAILQQPPADVAWLTFSPDSAEFAFFLLHGHRTDPIKQGFAAYLASVLQPPEPEATSAAYDDWALEVLQQFARFQLLAAVRQGPYGVEQLNQRVATVLAKQHLIPRTEGWYPGRPVMVVQNDYSTGLMNGDVGICLPRFEIQAGKLESRLRVVFPGAEADQQVRWILPSRLPQVETVYAMTVHKSQGSEFQHAVLILPEQGSALLSRELVYTGITRAAQQFSLLSADPAVLSQAVLQKTERSGGLRLQL
jgi:exodeoxyribonuclease V alpha subunit